MKFIFTFVILFALNMQFAFAATLSNAGFTGDKVLVSKTTPVIGESVRLSMPLYNESGGTLSGAVVIYLNDTTKLAEQKITLRNTEFSGSSFEWKPKESGKFTITFKFENTTLEIPKKPKEVVVLENRTAKTDITVLGESGEKVVTENGLLKEYETNVPASKNPSDGFDAYRASILEDIQSKTTTIKKDIRDTLKQNQEYEARLTELKGSLPKANGNLLTPVQYLYAWILGIVAYTIANPILFYGLGLLIVIILIRFIARKYTKIRYRNSIKKNHE
jgi:hypothetical protein